MATGLDHPPRRPARSPAQPDPQAPGWIQLPVRAIAWIIVAPLRTVWELIAAVTHLLDRVIWRPVAWFLDRVTWRRR